MGCGGSKNQNGAEDGYQNQNSPHRNHAEDRSKHKYADSRHHNNNNNVSKNNYNNKYNNDNNNSPRRGGTHPYPQSKYATNTPDGSANGEGFPEATDKGYKRRIRNLLIEATQGTDIEAIERAKEKFENNRLQDCGDLTRANDRLRYLKLRRDLRDAIRRSHVGVLEKTIEKAESSEYAGQLEPQIEAARRKLDHLQELNAYNHDILAMDQLTISEIHSYHRPPACVHDVMAATYMLLGHDESTLRDWSYLQSMSGKVGRGSLIHQVREFDSNNVDERTAGRVKEILDYHELGEVRVASNGAATFHVWASNIVDKVQKDKEEEEERLRREEEERERREQAASKTGSKGKKR